MGKHKKQMKKNGEEFRAKVRAAGEAGEEVTVSELRLAFDHVCGYCNAKSTTYGGIVELKKCGKCMLAYYCCRDCQVSDWPRHKALCKDKQGQNKAVNTSVLSVPQLMLNGHRVLTNLLNDSIILKGCPAQPADAWSNPKIPVSAIRVRVSNSDRSAHFTINALYSMGADASSISEPLAARLGLVKSGNVFISGFRCTDIKAGLPSNHVDVECMDVVCNHGQSAVPKSTRVAFLIVPSPGNDMVLGKDWFTDLATRANRNVVLDYAPDKCRLKFLPPGEECAGEDQLEDFANAADIDDGDFISVPWGRPDPGPCYNPQVIDFTHHVRPERTGRAALDAILLG